MDLIILNQIKLSSTSHFHFHLTKLGINLGGQSTQQIKRINLIYVFIHLIWNTHTHGDNPHNKPTKPFRIRCWITNQKKKFVNIIRLDCLTFTDYHFFSLSSSSRQFTNLHLWSLNQKKNKIYLKDLPFINRFCESHIPSHFYFYFKKKSIVNSVSFFLWLFSLLHFIDDFFFLLLIWWMRMY